MPLKVQLIHPPAYLNPTALTALRPSLPLGLAYVAGTVEQAGHQVSIIDAVGEDADQIVIEGDVARLGSSNEKIVARIEADTQVVGISTMFTYQWPLVRSLIADIHAARPDLLLLGGGEHFTGLPELSLEESELDLIALGEGEETMAEILERFEQHLAKNPASRGKDPRPEVAAWLKGCVGTAYREDGVVVQEERRARIRDVDDIPRPAWKLFDVQGYDDRRLVNGVKKGRTIPIFATRGCPYRCSYCSSPNAWTTKWVARDYKLVVDEIQSYVEDFGATNFPFQDLTAILKRDWIVGFCEEIIARKLDITWQMPTGTRCEVVDDEVAMLLKKSGALQVNFAPESGSERVRKKIQKQMRKESLFSAVSSATKAGLNVTCFFVLGFPGDEVQDFKDTVKWTAELARLGVDDVAVGFYFPIPGSKFFGELLERGHVKLSEEMMMAPIFVHDRYLSEGRNYSEGLKARTLTYWRYRLVWSFYSRAILINPKRIFRILSNILSGREESKFDSFMQILKERFFTRRAASAS